MSTQTEILEAVKNGDIAKVQSLLKADPDLIYAKTDNQIPLVLLATYQRNPRLLEVILSNSNYELDIFEAAALGVNERVQELLNNQADLINSTSPDGFSPLGLASFFGHADTVKLLIEKGANVNQASKNDWQVQPLHSAVAARSLEIVTYLLENGAEVNTQQQHGFTPLHAAAQNGDADMIKLLLEHKADINATTSSGETAMDIALKCKHTEAAHMFVAG
ncbi:ankyrin repeat domain-containing protein [Adhaeribacter radiodurans]|uniref:Ankyrin repeat domain-containing protein n=1 Tax=Adhaeribacter radiodurans TaxID=2745197 RepID=A0A7L7L3B0_9BACT|nr:ankyrin repeat domain-containing protein [Adhaeribacter radiodurans]QMU27278.1 ankyrin repeat domain-containing protein [Adhaeribacter radiodurans]